MFESVSLKQLCNFSSLFLNHFETKLVKKVWGEILAQV